MRINKNHVVAGDSGLSRESLNLEASVFHEPNVFKFNGYYFEFIADPSYVEPSEKHDFRVLLGADDYDYVENEALNKKLLAAYKSIKGEI